MSITWPTSLGSPKSSVSGSGSGELTTFISILYSRFLISSTIPGLAMVTVVKEIANNVRENNPNILFNVTDSLYCWQCWASILEESDWVEGSNCWVHSDMRQCQIRVRFESRGRLFFKALVKRFWMAKYAPIIIIWCIERGFYKRITWSPVLGVFTNALITWQRKCLC